MIVREIMTAYAGAMDTYFAEQSSSREGYGNVYVGGATDDTVVNYANGTVIATGAGKDNVTSIAGGVYIETGEDDDSIIAVGMGTEISDGAGNDKVYSQYGNATIRKGTGADKYYIDTGSLKENGVKLINNPNDTQADMIITPGFTFQYVKNKGLLIDPYYTAEQEEDEEDYDVEINIYN